MEHTQPSIFLDRPTADSLPPVVETTDVRGESFVHTSREHQVWTGPMEVGTLLPTDASGSLLQQQLLHPTDASGSLLQQLLLQE